jgi:hypothetical protein
VIDTDWARIERILDSRTTAHSCAFCGTRIPIDDEARWGLAVRRLSGHTSVVWVHPACFVEKLHPKVRPPFEDWAPGAHAI